VRWFEAAILPRSAHCAGMSFDASSITMKTRLLLLACFVGFATAASAAEPDSTDRNALALADALHLHDISVLGFRLGFERNSKGRLPEAVIDCANRVDLDFLRPRYGTAIKATLSAAEIDEALAFYQSRPGELFVAHQLREHREKLAGYPALEAAAAAGEPTREEFDRIKEFVLSPLGKKVGQLSDLPDFNAVQREMASAVEKRCGGTDAKP
jgi:hypothetical protein